MPLFEVDPQLISRRDRRACNVSPEVWRPVFVPGYLSALHHSRSHVRSLGECTPVRESRRPVVDYRKCSDVDTANGRYPSYPRLLPWRDLFAARVVPGSSPQSLPEVELPEQQRCRLSLFRPSADPARQSRIPSVSVSKTMIAILNYSTILR